MHAKSLKIRLNRSNKNERNYHHSIIRVAGKKYKGKSDREDLFTNRFGICSGIQNNCSCCCVGQSVEKPRG